MILVRSIITCHIQFKLFWNQIYVYRKANIQEAYTIIANIGSNFQKHEITRDGPMKTSCLARQMFSPTVGPEISVFVCTEEEEKTSLHIFFPFRISSHEHIPKILVTEQGGSNGNASDLHSGGARFEF
jgi:hypothetical protein